MYVESRVTSCHFDKQQRLRGFYMWGTRLHTIFLKMHDECTVYIMDIFLYKLDVLPTFNSSILFHYLSPTCCTFSCGCQLA